VSLDPDAFRAALGRFACGVTVVTVREADGTDHGMTVSAFCSVSLTPPMVLICIERSASMYDALMTATHFAVNVLAAEQEPLARRFAGVGTPRFLGVGFTRADHGTALLDEALAVVECRITARHAAGDHTIIVGETEAASVRDARPLLYYRGGFATLER